MVETFGGIVMKSIMKISGIIALVAAIGFSFTACEIDPGSENIIVGSTAGRLTITQLAYSGNYDFNGKYIIAIGIDEPLIAAASASGEDLTGGLVQNDSVTLNVWTRSGTQLSSFSSSGARLFKVYIFDTADVQYHDWDHFHPDENELGLTRANFFNGISSNNTLGDDGTFYFWEPTQHSVTNGSVTITDIPSTYNGRYAFSYRAVSVPTSSDPSSLIAADRLEYPHVMGGKIENGTVTLKVWGWGLNGEEPIMIDYKHTGTVTNFQLDILTAPHAFSHGTHYHRWFDNMLVMRASNLTVEFANGAGSVSVNSATFTAR
jgi:hypothetical protein